jgi:hypothetical protein
MKNKVYKFIQEKYVRLFINIENRELYDNDWISVCNSSITIRARRDHSYAWDGCSPKKNWLDITWGTPDGRLDFKTKKPITYYASLFHDAIYQFKNEIPISRKEADIIFKLMLKDAGFYWWRVYYWMVRLFGWLYGDWKHKTTQKGLKIKEIKLY